MKKTLSQYKYGELLCVKYLDMEKMLSLSGR
jgi:hypothetical protein